MFAMCHTCSGLMAIYSSLRSFSGSNSELISHVYINTVYKVISSVCVCACSACGGVTRRPRGQSRRQRGRSTCTTQGARRPCSPRWRDERASLFARGGCPASTPPAPWPTTASTARVSPPSPTPMKNQVCMFVSAGENNCVYLR